MKKQLTVMATLLILITGGLFLSRCSGSGSEKKPQYGGYDSQVKWGEHLVAINGCGHCHTPKKMTPMGQEDDSSLLLSGHPAKQRMEEEL